MCLLAIPFVVWAAEVSVGIDTQVKPAPSKGELAIQLVQTLDQLDMTLDVKSKIKLRAMQLGVDESLALNIACAESQFKANAKNPYSTAGGVFQFLTGSWRYYGLKYWGSLEGRSKMNADDNIELALLVLRDSGSGDWLASKFEGFGGGWANKPVEKGLCPA